MFTAVFTDQILFVLMLHSALQHFMKSDCTLLQGLDVMLCTSSCRVLITSFEGIVSNAAEISRDKFVYLNTIYKHKEVMSMS